MLTMKEASSSLTSIPSNEIEFHPNSFGDSDGRLFSWKEQLYRGISTEWAPFLNRLTQDGVIQHVVERELLIETELTPWTIDGYEMVVRHRAIPFLSYAHEWCPSMLKDAALTTLALAQELTRYELGLKDAHPWNVLFDGPKPIFVDLTSIAPLSSISGAGWYEEFCRYTLYPLELMSQGKEHIARRLFWEYDGVRKSDFVELTQPNAPLESIQASILRFLQDWWQRVPQSYRPLKNGLAFSWSRVSKQLSRPKSYMDFLERSRQEVSEIHIPLPEEDASISSGKLDTNPGPKYDMLHQILAEKSPSTVLDVSIHAGWVSALAGRAGSKVVSFNNDSSDAEQLYQVARHQGLQILPLVMDFARPTPAYGLSDHCFIAATERFHCDMVFAVSLVDHIVAQRHLNFEQIVKGLAQFSNRWVVAEFVLPIHDAAAATGLDRIPWYTLDNFAHVLGKHFRDVRLISSEPETGILFLCEK